MEDKILMEAEEIKEEAAQEPTEVEVIGVRFREGGKVYWFDPEGVEYQSGTCAIVDTARGVEFGYVVNANTVVPVRDLVLPLRRAIRVATPDDVLRHNENVAREKEALEICAEKIRKHNLGMKLIDAEYTFDNSKLLFYFTANGRVDFRALLKDLASVFHTRIDLRQIGIRDEAKMLGGIGVCGRPFCCSTFLSDFVQVSIKMAKEQNLSLNSSKISGACGRLMCCLRYEYDTYAEEIKRTPPVGAKIETADGPGTIIETYPLTASVKAIINDKNGPLTKVYSRDEVKVLYAPPEDDDEANEPKKRKKPVEQTQK